MNSVPLPRPVLAGCLLLLAWALGFGSGLLGLDDIAGKNFVRCVR